MAENSAIEWTTHTWNPWIGCTKVSEGCRFCYAESLTKGRMQLDVWGPRAQRKARAESAWSEPFNWNKKAKAAGERHRVFCASLADVFEGPETCQDHYSYQVIMEGRTRLWKLIEDTPDLDWLLLTKRPQNVNVMIPGHWHNDRPLPANVWIGTSVEDQKTADERIPHLLKVDARVRFLSCEPLLGPVDLSAWVPPGALTAGVKKPKEFDHWPESRQEKHLNNMARAVYMARCAIGINWVICGGESGPNARPMHPEWARSLKNQCEISDIPFFFKQWGEHVEVPEADAKHGDFYFMARERGTTDGKGRILLPTYLAFTQYPWKREDPPMKGAEAGRWSPYYDALMRRVGKKAAGRLLDGREWSELPEVRK